MSCRVLVVEDEILVAMEIENIVEDMGYLPIGVAQDSKRARELAKDAEVAFVDLNLIDGPTGIELGRELAHKGVTVLYMTANPAQLGDGVPGPIGVLPKPVNDTELQQAVKYCVALRQRSEPVPPPSRLRLFSQPLQDQQTA
jgi:two-component system, response regulator PdtaR